MRAFISAAADSVKVTTNSSLTSQVGLASHNRYAQRSANTLVFPDPAAAETSRLLPVVEMASFWASVQCFVAELGSVFVGIGSWEAVPVTTLPNRGEIPMEGVEKLS